MDSTEFRRLAGIPPSGAHPYTASPRPNDVNLFDHMLSMEIGALFTEEEKAIYMAEYQNMTENPPLPLRVEIERKSSYITQNLSVLGIDELMGPNAMMTLKLALIERGAPVELVLKVGPLTFLDMLDRHIKRAIGKGLARKIDVGRKDLNSLVVSALQRSKRSTKRKTKRKSKSKKKM